MEAHILLVEDDSTARRLLAEVLEGAGYHITMAQDGETALQMLEQQRFDVVVSDIRMHNVDGLQVLHAAKQCQIPPSVILLTGFGSLESAVAALRVGAYDYLLKPVAPKDLLQRVEGAVERYRTEERQHHAIRVIEQGLSHLRQGQTGKAEPNTPLDTESTLAEPPADTTRYIRVGMLTLDSFRHTALFRGEPLHLTPIEYAMLRCLAESAERVVSYRDIVQWSHGHQINETDAQALLKAHIRNLRRKIDAAYLVNVRGAGYMLVNPEQCDSASST